jgi:phage regulator Rha-like protein
MNNIQIIEYNNIRVLTTQQVAESYQTSTDTVTRNFNRNKDRYTEGKHYIALEGEEKNAFVDCGQIDRGLKNAKTLYLWTQKGCLLHAKSLNTDVAWEVYDKLVDNYFAPVKQLSQVDMMRIQLGMIDNHEDRITNLENNMTLDYGQQIVLGDAVNKTVIDVLGGKNSNAYNEIGKKVFAECNRDLKHYFNVNARNNVPKKRFDEAVEYAKNWKPCTNTMMLICNHNAQMSL